MNSKNVHRGISNLNKHKLSGDSKTDLGRLPKIHRNYKKKIRVPNHRQTPADNLFQQYLNYFLVIAGLLLVGGIFWMAYSQMTGNSKTAQQHSLAQETFEVHHPAKAECLQIVSNFLKASSPLELKGLIHLTRVPENDAFNLVLKKKKELGDVITMEWGGADETNGLSVERVYLSLKEEQLHTVYLRPDDAGTWRVDLDSFLLHATKTWQEIIEKNSCSAVIRAMISSDYYYNGLFADEKEWICVSLLPAGQSQKIYGYLHPDSANFRAVVEILKSENPAPAILEISRDVGMEPLQYEIKSIVSQGWVESNKNFSDNFNYTPKNKNETSSPPH
jgi:hypothetical protein